MLTSTPHSIRPPIWGWGPLKLVNIIKPPSAIHQGVSFSSKVKGSLCWVQMWAPLLIAYMESFKSLVKGETSWGNVSEYTYYVILGTTSIRWTEGKTICQPVHGPRAMSNMPQTNIMATLMDCPHNIHHKPISIMAKDGSIWPSTLGRWHGTQLCTWSFHVWPSHPSNNNTLKGWTFWTRKFTWPIITSNVVRVVYYK
jgi:hypothetical protein